MKAGAGILETGAEVVEAEGVGGEVRGGIEVSTDLAKKVGVLGLPYCCRPPQEERSSAFERTLVQRPFDRAIRHHAYHSSRPICIAPVAVGSMFLSANKIASCGLAKWTRNSRPGALF